MIDWDSIGCYSAMLYCYFVILKWNFEKKRTQLKKFELNSQRRNDYSTIVLKLLNKEHNEEISSNQIVQK